MARVPTAPRPRAWTPPQARIDGDRLLKARQAEQRVMEAKAKVEAEAKRVEEMESQKLDEKVDDLREQLDRLTSDLPKIIPSGGGGKRMVERVFTRDPERYREALGLGSSSLARYADRAAVNAAIVPADADNIIVDAYSATANPSAGRANYRAASDADYAATPERLRLTDAAGRKFIINETQINVLMAGADPTGVADSAPAFEAVRDLLQRDSDYRGGIMHVPAGRYKLNSTIEFTEYATGVVHNTYVRGGGVLATTLDFSGAPANSDGIVWGEGTHFGISDLMITGAPRHGLVLGGGTDYSSQFFVSELRVQQCGGDGIYSANSFMGKLDGVWSLNNGGIGVNFAGNHTSIEMRRVWGDLCGGAGIRLNSMCYSSLISCVGQASEYGFDLTNLNGVSFLACGTEINRKDGFRLRTSDALASGALDILKNINGVTFQNCFNIANGKDAAGTYASFMNLLTANSRPINITIEGCSSVRNNVADASIIANGASGTIVINEKMPSYDGTISSTGTVKWIGRRFNIFPTVRGNGTAGVATYTAQGGTYMLISPDEIVYDLRIDWSAHTGSGSMIVETTIPFLASGNYPVSIYFSAIDYATAPTMGLYQNATDDIILVFPVDNAGNTIIDLDTAAQLILSGKIRVA